MCVCVCVCVCAKLSNKHLPSTTYMYLHGSPHHYAMQHMNPTHRLYIPMQRPILLSNRHTIINNRELYIHYMYRCHCVTKMHQLSAIALYMALFVFECGNLIIKYSIVRSMKKKALNFLIKKHTVQWVYSHLHSLKLNSISV